MNPFLQTLYLAFQAIFMRLQFIDGSFRILIIGYQKIVATSLCLFKRPLCCTQIVKVGKLYFHVLPFPVKCHEVVSASFLRQFLQGFNLCIVQIVVWVLCVGGILQGNHVSNHILLVNGLAAQWQFFQVIDNLCCHITECFYRISAGTLFQQLFFYA